MQIWTNACLCGGEVMRSDFEKLPQIESHLHNVVFDEGSNEYLAKKMGHLPFEFSEWFLNGSWIIYQHQQSKVDELQKRVDGAYVKLAMLRQTELWREDDIFELFEELEQALKGGSTPNLNTDENGECRHFSTTMFADGKAECFHCDAVVNEQREVIGKQSKGLHPFFKKESK